MNTESAKGKKDEILDLLKNYNKLRSEEEFKEVKYNLPTACKEGDLDLIKIFLCETIKNNSDTFHFKIDSTNRTASLLTVSKDIKEVIIPRTVEHESIEYLITSICCINSEIKTLKFAEDSAVKKIYGYYFCQMEEIYFPASLIELKEDWCYDSKRLKKIGISPSNGQFKIIDDKCLIGKSDPNKDEFDKLLFVCRDIKEISIPSNIKIISSYAFENCCNLIKVEIPPNSNLQTIESSAFSFTEIKELYFPASLKELKEGWCYDTLNLTKITISPSNSQFKVINNKYLIGKSDPNKDEFDKLLFGCRNIKKICIPSNIKIISSYAFENCCNLIKVEIPPNSNLQTIESSAFSFTGIKEIYIPSKVTKICEGAFFYYKNLTKVKIPPNSNLQTIKVDVFSDSNISEIFIPSNVTEICKWVFYNCKNLTKVEIPPNSNLQTIESDAFSSTRIKEIYFPTSLKQLKEGWCKNTSDLTKITISPSNGQFKFIDDKYLFGKSDPNKDEFDKLLFGCRNIKEICIPSNIKIISSCAFENCCNLTKVEISPNSNLQTIGEYAFSFTEIKEIYIPSKVSKICEGAFRDCKNLLKVKISSNSNLQTIGEYAFSDSNIRAISIPSKVTKICKWAFYSCENLTKVEIPPNSNLQTIERFAFSESKIKEIYIPSTIKIILSYAFTDCSNLTKVEIPPNSNLQTIESNTFSFTKIKSIFIPSKVSKICDDAFKSCNNLQIVEISEESTLESFPLSAFDKNSKCIIMIPTSLKKSKKSLSSDNLYKNFALSNEIRSVTSKTINMPYILFFLFIIFILISLIVSHV